MLLLLLCGDIHTNPGPQYVYEDSSTSSSMISDCLSILHLNIRSIRHKIEYIKTELFDFDVLCFTETHIGSDYDINCLSLEDYHQPIYKNRDNAGGGVMMYIKSNLSFKVRHDLFDTRLELVWIELFSKGRNILIGTLYRPPSATADIWDTININFENATSVSDRVVILGDFNEDQLNPAYHNLKDIMSLNSVKNMITEPTRVTDSSSTLLDPIIISDQIVNLGSGIIPVESDISDHSITYRHMRLGYINKSVFKRKIWLYKHADFLQLNQMIDSVNWENFFFMSKDVNTAAKSFTEKLLSFAHICIPNKIVTVRPNDKPWYDSKIRIASRKRDRLKNKASKSNNSNMWMKYKKCRNHVNNLIKEAKSRYFDKLDSTTYRYNDQTQFWKTMKHLIKGKKSSQIPPLSKTNDSGDAVLYFTDAEKATLLNEYFTGISKSNPPNSVPFFQIELKISLKYSLLQSRK